MKFLFALSRRDIYLWRGWKTDGKISTFAVEYFIENSGTKEEGVAVD